MFSSCNKPKLFRESSTNDNLKVQSNAISRTRG